MIDDENERPGWSWAESPVLGVTEDGTADVVGVVRMRRHHSAPGDFPWTAGARVRRRRGSRTSSPRSVAR